MSCSGRRNICKTVAKPSWKFCEKVKHRMTEREIAAYAVVNRIDYWSKNADGQRREDVGI